MTSVVRHKVEISTKTIFIIFGLIAAVWLLGQLTRVFAVLTIALVLVGTFDPLVSWLERRGWGRGRSLVLVFVLAAVLLAGIVLLMVPPLIAQFASLIEDAPKAREKLVAVFSNYSWGKPLVAAVEDLPLDELSKRAGSMAIGYSEALFEAIGYGISTLFLSIYLLADPVRAKGLLYAIVPRHHHVKFAKILLELKVIVGGYMRGQFITSASIAVFVFILLKVLGAENALAIALFAGLTDIMPFVGGYIASTPVVIAVTPQGTTVTLVVLGLMVLYQEFESRILVPRVYGRVLRLPPAVVLVALLVGGTLGGILGALLSLPIAAGLQMLVRELRFELPGEAVTDVRAQRMDERAKLAYEQLADGASAAEAGVIADDLASMVKKSEEEERTLFSAQMAAVKDPTEPS